MLMKRYGYFIAALILLLLALQVKSYLYCLPDIEGDEAILLEEMRTDELQVIQTINKVNNDNNLGSLEGIFNTLPPDVCYTYADQSDKLLSWKGVIDARVRVSSSSMATSNLSGSVAIDRVSDQGSVG